MAEEGLAPSCPPSSPAPGKPQPLPTGALGGGPAHGTRPPGPRASRRALPAAWLQEAPSGSQPRAPPPGSSRHCHTAPRPPSTALDLLPGPPRSRPHPGLTAGPEPGGRLGEGLQPTAAWSRRLELLTLSPKLPFRMHLRGPGLRSLLWNMCPLPTPTAPRRPPLCCAGRWLLCLSEVLQAGHPPTYPLPDVQQSPRARSEKRRQNPGHLVSHLLCHGAQGSRAMGTQVGGQLGGTGMSIS